MHKPGRQAQGEQQMPKVAKALTDRAVKNLKYPEPGGDKGPVAFAVGEVRGATWNEIDLKAGLWIIPAAA